MGRIAILAAVLSWLGAFAPGHAAETTSALLVQYQIEQPSYGHIGTYTNSIVKIGTATIVQTSVRVLVKIFGLVAYRESSDRTEEWQSGRLISFHSVTNKDGKVYDVSGRAEGDRFVTSGPDGTFTAPADVQPPNLWSVNCLQSNTMLSAMSGRIFRASIADQGQDDLSVAGHKYRAHKYEIVTDRPHVVWFDDHGLPLQIETTEDDQPVRLVLAHYPEQAQVLAAAVPSR